MFKIALKMIFRDKVKFITLIAAIAFSTVLVLQQGSIFIGLMRLFSTTVRVTQAPIWVMHQSTEQVDGPTPIPEAYIPQIRSIKGVKWAYPFMMSNLSARLPSGKQNAIEMIGVDAETLYGMPNTIVEGSIEEINSPEAVIVDNNELPKIGNPKIGDTFEINDNQARVVGIIDIPRNMFSYPIVYTTYDRAKDFAPPKRNMLSFILAEVEEGQDVQEVIKRIEQQTELKALSQEQFFWKTIGWYLKNTGIPINFGIAVALGVIVGVSITSQTFYAFVTENTRYLATLRAIGTPVKTLIKMVLIQSALVGYIGFSIGVMITGVFGSTVPNISKLVFYTPYQLFLIVLFAVIVICAVSSLLSLRRVVSIEPASVFRG